jgi:hypothetical protein
VPHHDGDAIGEALHRLLTDPDLHRRMSDEARRLAPAVSWSTVAATYRALADRLLGDMDRPGRLLASGATV